MLAAARAGEGAPLIDTQTCALVARSGTIELSHYRGDDVSAVVAGRPRWVSPALAELARQQGHAAALAHGYARDGAQCLEQMRGPFTAVVLQPGKTNALLAIDRMGIHKLCYAHVAGRLVFGTDAQIVAAHPALKAGVSRQGVFNYLYSHVVPAPGTIFAGVSKLLPGESLAFENGMVTKRFYWKLSYADQSSMRCKDLEHRFHDLLRQATKRAMEGTRTIGAFLSGGTDSSTVTGLLGELTGKPADTYSIGFAADGFDEMNYARIASRHFRTSAHEYYLKPGDVVDAIPMIAEQYDEPFGNESAVPTYFCAKMARDDGIQVMLAGDGGDEVFGGNVRYAKQKVFELYGSVPGLLRSHLLEPMIFALPNARASRPLAKLQRYIEQARIPLPDRLETYNFLHRSALEEIFEPQFLAEVDGSQPLELLRQAYGRTDSASPVNRMMNLDLKATLADNDLRKVSRMCQAAGLEARYPLLDEDLVEFGAALPASMKVRGFKLRFFFKRALTGFLPPETLAKSKHGFGMPFGLWLREHDPLKAIVHDSLQAFGARGIVKSSYIDQLLREHQSTHATYFGKMIWLLTTLECWLAARRL